MRPSEAIDDGYDEITHIYFIMMQAMPDDVVAQSNGMARSLGPGWWRGTRRFAWATCDTPGSS